MKRTRIRVDSVVIDGAAASSLDPARLRAELATQIARVVSSTASPQGSSRVPVVRVNAPANAGDAGVARAVASALPRSHPSRGGTR